MPRTSQRNDTPGSDIANALNNGAAAKPLSKIGQVLELLRREQGATLAELVEATGWQPHTTRAALTGLRKKGHVLAKSNLDGATYYHVEP